MRVGAEEVEAIGHLQRVHARVRRHRRQPEPQHPPQVGHLRPQREAPAQHPPEAEHHQRRGAEVAQQQPAGAFVGEHHQDDRERDRHPHVRPRGEHIGARALVYAQLRVGHLQVGERPQAEGRAVDQRRVVHAEQQAGDLAREGHHQQRGHRRGPRHRGGRRTRDAFAPGGVLVVEVEPDERLSDPHAQEDARQDHRRQAAIRPPRRSSCSDGACTAAA